MCSLLHMGCERRKWQQVDVLVPLDGDEYWTGRFVRDCLHHSLPITILVVIVRWAFVSLADFLLGCSLQHGIVLENYFWQFCFSMHWGVYGRWDMAKAVEESAKVIRDPTAKLQRLDSSCFLQTSVLLKCLWAKPGILTSCSNAA